MKKKLIQMGFDPMTHRPRTDIFSSLPHLLALANLKELMDHPSWEDHAARLQAEAVQMARLQYLQFLFQPPQVPNNNNNNNGNSSTAFADLESTINLLNSMSCSSNKDIGNSVHFENPNGSSSFGSGSGTSCAANLQSLHDRVPFSHLPDLQIPCSTNTSTTTSTAQTPAVMNKNSDDMVHQAPDQLTAFMISHVGSENSPDSPWFPTPPTANTSSYGDVVASTASLWPDLLLEDSLFHEIA